MATGIEWTDETWNPVTGCVKVSPGCKNCYAENVANRFFAKQYPPVPTLASGEPDGRHRRFTDVMTHEDRLDQPLRWKKPRKVFVNSMSDLFHEDVPDDFIFHCLATMSITERHTYQILTKRPERALALFTSNKWTFDPWPLRNVWLGVSCENQEYADKRIPLLLQTPAWRRFISYEPALGRIDIRPYLNGRPISSPFPVGLDWVIVGGESGPGARSFDVSWARSVVEQCRNSKVACFVKQLGSTPTLNGEPYNPYGTYRANGKPSGTYSTKGGKWSEWPEDIRVREFPA